MKRSSLTLLVFLVSSLANPSVAQNQAGFCLDGSTPQQQCADFRQFLLGDLREQLDTCVRSNQDTPNVCFSQHIEGERLADQHFVDCLGLGVCVRDGGFR